jgi:S1-C subfamily serine protease
MEADVLTELSNRISTLATQAGRHVVRVEGRRGGPSSGVAWSADGVILTAHHTLERDEEVRIGLPSGEDAAAEVVGRDPSTDLAVLRAKGAQLAPPDWVDEAQVAVGQLVLGVSRPGRGPRASLGIIARAAGEYRATRGGRIDRYLESTLELHPGVSGSLVLAAGGGAIGLATAGIVRGAAMILPGSTLRRVTKALLTHGEIRRGYLGLATYPVPLPSPLKATTGEEVALLVSRVDPESPAARAGLVLGDALLSFGGETLQDPGELMALLAEDRIGDTVAMKILRGGEVRELQVTIGARSRGACS